MRKIVCCVLIAICIVIPVYAAADGATVDVREASVVHSPVLTLGDIAVISGDDTAKVNLLQQMELGAAPRPGSSATLNPELLSARMASAGADLTNIHLQAPAVIKVSADAQVVGSSTLLEAAVRAVKERLNLPAENYTITPVNTPMPINVWPGRLTIKANLLYGIRFSGVTSVEITVYVEDRYAGRTSIPLMVKAYKEVIVAARPIMANETITQDCIGYNKVDMSKLSGGFITDANKMLGLVSKRSITPGSVITDSMFAKPVIIKRGSAVSITARIGSIEVTAPGQALQDGCEGQIIRVQNLNSSRILAAKILDDSTVLVLDK